jgi:hypothetical protein
MSLSAGKWAVVALLALSTGMACLQAQKAIHDRSFSLGRLAKCLVVVVVSP